MVKNSVVRRGAVFVLFLACAGMVACQFDLAHFDSAAEPLGEQAGQDQTPSTSTVKILNEGQLPDTFPRAPYELRFMASGGVPTLHWHLEKGALPAGIKLEDDGSLHGQAERTGEFQFTLSVSDSNQPAQVVQKEFLLRVRSALTLVWKNPARVNGSRIEGSVVVSNTTSDDMDLTFVVMAVADNGRATAIGYQRFVLASGTVEKELPFGETLPHGGYVVHVDAVGEVAVRNLIYRQRMETPGPLQVTVGP
jgi:hypothetical protein